MEKKAPHIRQKSTKVSCNDIPVMYVKRTDYAKRFEERIMAMGTALWTLTPRSPSSQQPHLTRGNMRKYKLGFEGREISATILSKKDDSILFSLDGREYEVSISPEFSQLRERGTGLGTGAPDEIRAPISGIISKISCNEGDKVKAGDCLLVLEAMKMENSLSALTNGVVKKIHCQVGSEVKESELLISIEMDENSAN